jgi:CMP-N,N'-diacetyllegionaminic acid synthase
VNVLGLILARGGSKRVPRKNLRLLNDQSLLVWAIGVGMYAPSIDCLVVSSEDDEILREAWDHGADTIRRPEELATDEISSYPAMLHALDAVEEHYDYLCLLQPTSPFRAVEDVEGCIRQAQKSDLPAVASFTAGGDVPNGAIYVGRTDWLRDGGNFDGPAVGKFWMPISRSLDINTEADFALAEQLMKDMAA